MDISSMGKIDLHCHLDGSMGIDLIDELLRVRGIAYEREKLEKILKAPADCSSLAEYLKCFDVPLRSLQTKVGLSKAGYDLIKQAAADNVRYIEVRFAPAFSMEQGLRIPEIIESVIKGLKDGEKDFGVRSGIIVCGMRNLSLENNLSMLKSAMELYRHGVVGCDLAGDEKAYPTKLFADFFLKAKEYGIPFTIHSGECGSIDNVIMAIELGAKRLGHGIAMAKDESLIKICADRRIGVELCPTSNFQTKAVTRQEDYPFRPFYDEGVLLSINTDNRTVSDTNSTKELELMADWYGLDESDLRKIYRDSVELSFASDDVKNILLRMR